jgi:hypothetical protein
MEAKLSYFTWRTTPVSCCIHSDGIWNRVYRLVAASRTRARFLYTPCCSLHCDHSMPYGMRTEVGNVRLSHDHASKMR